MKVEWQGSKPKTEDWVRVAVFISIGGLGFSAVRVAAERDQGSEIKENSVMIWAE